MSQYGWTSLIIATKENYTEIVGLLLDAGANASTANKVIISKLISNLTILLSSTALFGVNCLVVCVRVSSSEWVDPFVYGVC